MWLRATSSVIVVICDNQYTCAPEFKYLTHHNSALLTHMGTVHNHTGITQLRMVQYTTGWYTMMRYIIQQCYHIKQLEQNTSQYVTVGEGYRYNTIRKNKVRYATVHYQQRKVSLLNTNVNWQIIVSTFEQHQLIILHTIVNDDYR